MHPVNRDPTWVPTLQWHYSLKHNWRIWIQDCKTHAFYFLFQVALTQLYVSRKTCKMSVNGIVIKTKHNKIWKETSLEGYCGLVVLFYAISLLPDVMSTRFTPLAIGNSVYLSLKESASSTMYLSTIPIWGVVCSQKLIHRHSPYI